MTEQAQQPPDTFAFQPGALQGIVNGQGDTWYYAGGNSGVTIEEIEEDEWETTEVHTTSSSSGSQALALKDVKPEGIRNSKHFFPSWEVTDMRTSKDGETFLV